MAMRPLDRLPSIRAKLGAVIVFAVAVTVLIMYIAVGFALRESERDREFREAFGEARVVAALAFTPAGQPSRTLRRVLAQVPHRVAVVDASQRMLAGDFPTPPTVARILSGQSSVDTGTVGAQEYIGVPVNRQGRIVGGVYIAYHVEATGVSGAILGTAVFVRSVWWQFLLAGAAAAFIALGLARFLARGLTQPLRDMADASGRMARGDYAQRVPVRSRDEVGQLAGAFNRMAGDMAGMERLRRDLVANVSHELKTPIAALRAHLENLLDGVEAPSSDVLSVMLRQSERLSRLVDQLLDLSKLESGAVPLEFVPVALAPLVDRVVTDVEAARGEERLEVRNEIPNDFPTVLADRERIYQVLFNVIDNAFRFTPAGGAVTVRGVRREDSIEISVEDTGPGIPAEHLPLVFERFYRVDAGRSRDDGGTGIGLAIARSVVEAHGGRIWVDSEPGRGSDFRISLPLTRAVDGPELDPTGVERDELPPPVLVGPAGRAGERP